MTTETGKNFIYKLTALLLAVLILLMPALPRPAEAASDYSSIRVKLNLSSTSLSVKVTGSYLLKENPSLSLQSGQTYTVSVSDSSIRLKGSGIDATLSSVTFVRQSKEANTDHLLTISDKNYLGDICFTSVSGKVQAVNTLDFEHYIYGVVQAELGNSFPLEALKAQAVCARCYAIRKIDSARSSSDYDIVGSASDQAYAGYKPASTKVIAAVDATKGEVLMCNGKIIEAFFSASNGGQTECTGSAWSGGAEKDARYPYLIQADDPYDIASCAGKSSYEQVIFIPADPTDYISSSNTYSNAVLDDLQNLAYTALKSKYSLSKATEVKLTKINSFENGKKRWPDYENSRCYVTAIANITVALPEEVSETLDVTVTLMVPSGSTYALAHDYLNGNFRLRSVEPAADGWNLTNRRYGHGIGMSQMGAMERAKQGMSYTQILEFYYPNTQLTTLSTGGGTGGGDNPTPPSGNFTVSGEYITGIAPGTDASALLSSLGSEYALYNSASAAKTSGTVLTGDLIKNVSGNTYYVVIFGDLDSDGLITLTDLLRLQKHLLGITSLQGAALKAADVTKDGSADIADLLRVQKHLLGVTSITQ